MRTAFYSLASPDARTFARKEHVMGGMTPGGEFPAGSPVARSRAGNRKLTQAQEQAVGAAFKQIHDAIAADPGLETADMYQMRQ